jgi:predicted ribosomally synthesized peptide with SipW-like signal peptide
MSEHAHRRPARARGRHVLRALRSARLRAVLGLGVVLSVGVTGTFAFWTDDVVISGTSFTAGTLDLQVNNGDSYATTTLSMSAMVPGNTSAEVLTVKNNGTAPLKYTLTGGLTGTDAAAYSTAAALTLTIRAGGTASAGACSGGTSIYSAALTSTTSTAIIGTRRGPLAASGGTEALCFQITFDAAAPSSLQGKTATATFTATGTSDVS